MVEQVCLFKLLGLSELSILSWCLMLRIAIKWSFSVCVNFKGDRSEVSRQKRKGKTGRGKTGAEVHYKGSCLTVGA